VRLVELELRAFPGVDRPFRIDEFAPGANLLLGPNASGKSRVAQAVRAVLDPSSSRGDDISIVAVFEHDGQRLRASRVGDGVRWERDGVPTEPPPLPDGHLLDGLFLGLEDLHRFGGSDRLIATRLATELAGGVDLAAARKVLAEVGPHHGRAEAKAWNDARDERRDAERRRDGLAAELAHRDELAERRGVAAARAASVEPLRTASDAIEQRRRLQNLNSEAERLPAGLERLHDRAAEDAQAWIAAVRDAQGEVDRWLRALDEATAAGRATGLAWDRPRAAHAEELRLLADRLAGAERDLEAAERALAEARARASVSDPGDAATADLPPGPTVDDLDELEALAQELDEAHSELASRKRSLARLEPVDGVSRADGSRTDATLGSAVRHAEELALSLSVWLQASRQESRLRTTIRVGALLGAVAAAAFAAWRASDGSLLASSEVTWWLAAAALFVVVALASEWTTLRRAAERRTIERTVRQAADRSDPDGAGIPSAWTPDAVRNALLDAARRAAALAAERDVRRESEARARELRSEVQEAEQEAAKAAERLSERAAASGLETGIATRSWLERARRARELRELARAERAARARGDDCAGRVAELRAEIERRWQAAQGDRPIGGESGGAWRAESVRSAASELVQAVTQRDRAVEAKQLAERQLAHAREAASSAERRRDEGLAALLGRDPLAIAESPPQALAELHVRLEAGPAWRAWQDEAKRLETLLAHAEQVLEPHPELVAAVEAGDEKPIRQALLEAEAAVEERDEATRQLAALDERISQARHDRRVEAARQRERAAHDALERALDASLDTEAAAFVLDRVEGAYRAERRPAALLRAERWFERFTQHAFTLRFDPAADGDDSVRAVDRSSGSQRSLSELSSATRAQLLLALRVASAVEAEAGGPPLPLVLDEALTTSDVGRFAAVVAALSELVREEGRQILYLSARRDDAVLWSELATRADSGVVAPTVLDLPRLRGRFDLWDPGAASETESAPEPPAPNGDTPARYGARLGVPAVDPWRPDAIHPFHLLHDRLELVQRLARWRISGLGQLGTLLDDPSAALAIVTDGERELLAARLAATRAWAEAWRVGRGRPVDRSALVASGAVSDRFLPAVRDLAAAHEGDAVELLAALERSEVKRFRDDARAALETWLEENGYLDRRQRLSAAELRLRAGAALEERRRAASPASDDPLDGADLVDRLELGMRSSGVLFDGDAGDA